MEYPSTIRSADGVARNVTSSPVSRFVDHRFTLWGGVTSPIGPGRRMMQRVHRQHPTNMIQVAKQLRVGRRPDLVFIVMSSRQNVHLAFASSCSFR